MSKASTLAGGVEDCPAGVAVFAAAAMAAMIRLYDRAITSHGHLLNSSYLWRSIQALGCEPTNGALSAAGTGPRRDLRQTS
jgi:hypothetical protein